MQASVGVRIARERLVDFVDPTLLGVANPKLGDAILAAQTGTLMTGIKSASAGDRCRVRPVVRGDIARRLEMKRGRQLRRSLDLLLCYFGLS